MCYSSNKFVTTCNYVAILILGITLGGVVFLNETGLADISSTMFAYIIGLCIGGMVAAIVTLMGHNNGTCHHLLGHNSSDKHEEPAAEEKPAKEEAKVEEMVEEDGEEAAE